MFIAACGTCINRFEACIGTDIGHASVGSRRGSSSRSSNGSSGAAPTGAAAADTKARASTCPIDAIRTLAIAMAADTKAGFQPEGVGGGGGGSDGGGDGGGAGGAGPADGGAAQGGQGGSAAGPPVPVEFSLPGQHLWQADLGGGKWQDVDPKWSDPLRQALRDGVQTIRLEHIYHNKGGGEVHSWYTIDCTDTTSITQQNEATGQRRELRAVQLMEPMVVEPRALAVPPPALPPPLEQPAAAKGPADESTCAV